MYLIAPGINFGMRDLVPWPGIKSGPLQLGSWSLSHWSSRKSLNHFNFSKRDLVQHMTWGTNFGCFVTAQVEVCLLPVSAPLGSTCLLSRIWLSATAWTVATRLLCLWSFPGRSTRVGFPHLLGLPHCEWIRYPEPPGRPAPLDGRLQRHVSVCGGPCRWSVWAVENAKPSSFQGGCAGLESPWGQVKSFWWVSDPCPLQLLVLSALILSVKWVLHRSLDLHFSPLYFTLIENWRGEGVD